jgi:hypothetical protein
MRRYGRRGLEVVELRSGDRIGLRAQRLRPGLPRLLVHELLVVRGDGSSAAYPAFRTAELGAGGGEIVASYDLSLVRVTSSRLVPLVTNVELARALHVRPNAIWDIHDPRVSDRMITFTASVSGDSGCRNPRLELTAGTVREIQASTSRICS